MIKRKKSVNGKQKGGQFERKICKELSLWISKGAREDIFWRSAMSGGRATVQRKRNQKNISQVGDISAVDSAGEVVINNFVIECKNYKDIKISSMYSGKRNSDNCLAAFWEELQVVSYACGKDPCLVFHQNMLPIFIAFNRNGINKFNLSLFEEVIMTFPRDSMWIIPFERFLLKARLRENI